MAADSLLTPSLLWVLWKTVSWVIYYRGGVGVDVRRRKLKSLLLFHFWILVRPEVSTCHLETRPFKMKASAARRDRDKLLHAGAILHSELKKRTT